MRKSKYPLLSAAVISVIGLPGAAIAQDSPAIEQIVVTGSNIRRERDFDTPSPVQTIGLQEINDAGVGQVQDLMRTLSVNAGSELSTSQNSRQGVSSFSLRGLGVSGTLTLVNGRRAGVSPIASNDGFFFTDANQYPVNMIERVEVLTDGASATYGSEAVGGVVNLITRDRFEGVEFGVETRDASNEVYQLNLAFGSSFDRGHFTTFMTYYTQDGNFRGDFDWLRDRDNGGNQLATASSWDSGTGAGRYNLALQNPDGSYSRSGGTVADAHCGSPNSVGVVNTFVAANNCRYSFIDQRRLIPEEQRFQTFSSFNYDVSDTIQLFSEVSYSSNKIRDGIGGAVLRNPPDAGGFFVPASHSFNYFVDNGSGDVVWDAAAVSADPSSAVDVIFRGRPLTTFDGDLADDIVRKYDNTRVVLGANAEISENWSLNTSYMYARTEFSDRQPRSYNPQAFGNALTSTTGWNPFGIAWADPGAVSVKDGFTVAGNSEADLALFATNRVFQSEAVQQVWEGIVSGDVFELSNGNTVTVAIGAQYRDFSYSDIADSLSVFRLDGRADPVFTIDNASQDAYAVFAEAIIPVSDEVEIQLALRYEDYGDKEGGDTTDPKIGAQWNLTDEWMLRASWGTSFQAPSVRNTAGAVGSGALADSATAVSPGDACNATSDSFNASQITAGGDLDPQSATNYNLGLVYRDNSFTGSVDYWHYDYEDLIQTGDDFQDILDQECSSGIYTPDPRVIRDPSGQLNSVTSNFVNVGEVQATGFDINANYAFEDVMGGDVNIALISTYVTTFDINQDGTSTFDGLDNRNRFIGFGSMPDLRANLSLTWINDRYNASLTGRYIDGYEDRTPTSSAPNSIDSQTVIDFQYGINLDGLVGNGSTNLSFGVNNIFDEDPPQVFTDRIVYDGQTHDPRGRIVYLRAKYSF